MNANRYDFDVLPAASDEAADQPPIAPEDFGSRLWWFVTCCAFIVLLAVLGIPTWLAMGA